MPIYMNYDRPEITTYLVHCEKCHQTWNTSEIKELEYFDGSHDNWCEGMQKNEKTGKYEGEVGKLHVYEYRLVKKIHDIWSLSK